jgi:putative DNA primase/helicase
LAEAFCEAYGEDWRYVAKWGKWLCWEADGWGEDDGEHVVGLAKLTTREALLWSEAQVLTPSGRREVNSIGTAKALLSFARSKPEISATVDQWDTDPMLLGVPGGVIDLRDGRMLPPERGQYITKRTACAPASGQPVLWLKYLERAHEGIEPIISYLQRYAGYCATGEIKEHALAFLYGTGRNGKGVFLETLRGVLGDYARSASMETFIEQRSPAHSTELARLHGARLVVTEEAAQGSRWNEGRVKHMTGGGKITAHYMRQDDFEFTPSFKLLIAANHKPMLRSVDEAIKSRIHLVPFNVTIPPEERDRDLLKKLEAEWPQILGWILDGCAEWQRTGLAVPANIIDATERYVEAEDVLGAWIEECCDRSGEGEGRALYENYRKWCEQQGEHAWSRRSWSNAMIERGFDPRKTDGKRLFRGITLKPGAGLP